MASATGPSATANWRSGMDSRSDLLIGLADAVRGVLNGWPLKLLGAGLISLFGPWRDAHAALLVVIMLDFVTGVIAAAKHGRLSSAVAKQKAVSKLLAYMGVLIAAYQLERVIVGSPFTFGADYTLSAATLYLVATEVMSILENLERITGMRLRIFGGHKVVLDKLRAQEREAAKKADEQGKVEGGTDRGGS